MGETAAETPSSQRGGDVNFPLQQLVYGAGLCNLQQALALLVIQRAMQADAPLDQVA